LWHDIDLAVSELVEGRELKNAIYYDGTYELVVDVTGGKPEYVEIHFLTMPWFLLTSRYQAIRLFTDGPVRGVGYCNYIPYSWTIRRIQ
jgi:hypothetical protein